MPFPFVYVCDVLDQLELLVKSYPPLLPRDLDRKMNDSIISWLELHRNHLNAFNIASDAVLRALRPHAIHDRVYGLDAVKLEKVIARAFALGQGPYEELRKWRHDLGACIERLMQKPDQTTSTADITNAITIDSIDVLLLQIASCHADSSKEVRTAGAQDLVLKKKTIDLVKDLDNLYKPLRGREAKWLTRMILKDYAPIEMPEELIVPSRLTRFPNSITTSTVSLRIPTAGSSAGFIEAKGLRRAPKGSWYNKDRVSPPRKDCEPVLLATPDPTPQSPHLVSRKRKNLEGSAVVARKPMTLSNSPLKKKRIEPSIITPRLTNTSTNNSSKTENVEPIVAVLRHVDAPIPVASTPVNISALDHLKVNSPERTVLGLRSSNRGSLPRQTKRTSSAKSKFKATTTSIQEAGKCTLTEKTCPFINCIFLLSPCIASVPYLTEDLLSWHRCRYITSPEGFRDPSFPRRSSTTGKKIRKIVLVESNRTAPTVEYMKEVGALDLRRNEKKDWVEVYDWRLLESITKVDRGKELDFSPWRKSWVGAV
ncbi:hypothetical protein B7494_g4424 [Chlorociboria aeruginascens]|nr:hypothetical protein B7494_g4424 [Chlorociboria aeruginascens]